MRHLGVRKGGSGDESENYKLSKKHIKNVGWSPGLVVMGGCGFQSQHRILNGHLFTLICCKKCSVCLKKTENKLKVARMVHFKKHIGVSKLLFLVDSV